ncbi:MAG: imidazole glycerol phosphate synthase subunit HisH [Leptospiraceae bacterium]|nr:imidazole glycerol phosphate synthase subunit HisH [Leptospiraceae bacterium]
MKPEIAVIDYGLGNTWSILNALKEVGAQACLSADPETLHRVDGIILPGVGTYPQGMQKLSEAALTDLVRSIANSGKPLLGICLGMQLLFDEGYEFGTTAGLGLIAGTVQKLELVEKSAKLPHVGWTPIDMSTGSTETRHLLMDVPDRTDMYFVHSFAAQPSDANTIIARAEYGGTHYCCMVQRSNIIGTQFHPEKSGPFGLQIFRNFVNYCEENKN